MMSQISYATLFHHPLLAKLCYNVSCLAQPQAAEFESVSRLGVLLIV